jgi:cytochrome d ubiquinol oxidase subunit II
MSIWAIIWYVLVFVLIAGYFILDGFDLGAGVLSPFIAKNDEEKLTLMKAIGPVWDGNEVWLLTGGGALFAAFAPAYATTFSGFYLAIILVLMGLIIRAVSVEFAAHDPAWRKLWFVLFFIGSLLPALLYGVAVGNIYAGIPMDAAGNYIGVPLIGLVTPFTLLCGLLGLTMCILQGACWLSVKSPLEGELLARARGLRRPVAIVAIVLFALVTLYALFIIKPELAAGLGVLRILFALVVVAALVFVLLKAVQPEASDLTIFLVASVACFALVGLLASSMFPTFVVSGSGDPLTPFMTATEGAAITAADASGDLTLKWMFGITCVALPLVLLYHFLVYRTFAGRLAD